MTLTPDRPHDLRGRAVTPFRLVFSRHLTDEEMRLAWRLFKGRTKNIAPDARVLLSPYQTELVSMHFNTKHQDADISQVSRRLPELERRHPALFAGAAVYFDSFGL